MALSALPTKATMYRTPRQREVILSEVVRTLENQSRAVTNWDNAKFEMILPQREARFVTFLVKS